ncbi:MAG: putative metal-dependent hydrolase [Bacteroidota bacterium]|nr:putative metal-dependent hydrolase [Bacteroidota bacterium]
MTDLEKLKYPIGKYTKPENVTHEMIQDYISIIESFTQKITKEVMSLSNEQLQYTYRPGGWTIRQLVHHCADSHINAFTRFKLALTEDKPTIKPYMEALWAELADSKTSIEPSLKMIEGTHSRWTVLLKSMSHEDFQKSFVHPEHSRVFLLEESLALYAWHCRHHLEHIRLAKGA